ncbi:DUF6443 domain-containing protein [Pedobacter chitinilyticus]|uniref:RHS repeat-associated core domain-containing protein n=1 Tax=Pedobacter chitinilyticus TaxID=2233776 RepID=A0A3S3SUJ7_9SPHI|nr:DUF6443 domain-containing protein [Pedobacter chitinilyticus]RWU07724.1 RHS repeat-associated core domain-containing protein [Pedobacter chitinilyticus]
MKTRLTFLVVMLGLTVAQAQQHKTYSVYNNQTELSASGSITLLPNFHAPSGSNLGIFIQGDCGPLLSTPSSNQNYILTRIFKVAGVNAQNLNDARTLCQENQTIQYFDGLGRPLQTVQVGASPSYQDIVTPVAYDALGREAVKYQPYTATGTNGSYRPTGIADQLAFYMGQASTSSIRQTSNPYGITVFEPSPLNRVERQGFPGDAWQPSNVSTEHTARLAYGTNNSDVNYGTTGFAVRLFDAVAVTNPGQEHQRTLSSSGHYGAGQLYLTISKDENWQGSDGKKGTVEEYKDKEGRVVLKRIFSEKMGNIEVLSTYYVYDDFGSLSFVLPPGANPDAGVPDATTLEQFCYQYRYDGRGRLIEKRLPGKGWEWMVYNKLDQLVLTQDALQRIAGQWLFTKYDALGRNVMTGIYNSMANRQDVQAAVDAHAILWEERDNGNSSGMHTGYGNQAFPTANVNYYHTISYYDDYDFHNNAFGQPNGTTQVSSTRTKGLLIGTRTTVLGTGNMLLTVNYYDDYGRIIQTKSEHHMNNGTDVVDMTYNFDGSIKNTTRAHNKGTSITTIASAYTYDHMGRKKTTSQSINGAAPTILSEMQYDEIGQLSIKKLANGLQKNEYTYNERGWLTSSSSPQFSINLKYNDGAHQQFNGNISGQIYTNNGSNTFTYQYDKLNRLINGTASGMTELLDYDLMGNIKSLNRDGTGAKVYNYTDGNRLESITGLTASYAYDANGNATTDGRNGVTLTYNHLSLPVTASKSGLNLSYTYDATGAKLRKVSTTGTTTTTDYVDGIQYTNNTIDFIQTEEGIARKSGSSYVYEYNLTDHLGNVRATFKVNGSTIEVLQRDNYYAFGMRKSALNDIGAVSLQNKYLYNGKELQEELEQYDYGARFYDPVIGRWNVVDPLAEKDRKTNPYAYAFNNPINVIDPDGKEGQWIPSIVNGKLTAIAEKGDNAQTLQKFIGVSQKQADAEFKNMKGGKITLSDNIPGVAAINGAILDTKSNPENYASNIFEAILRTPENYNCFESALAISNGETPIFDKRIDGDRFDATVEGVNFKDVTGQVSNYKFGKTIVAFADSQNQHAATYLGTSKDGTQYTWSKDGSKYLPAVKKVEILKDDYGKNVKYYNNKH